VLPPSLTTMLADSDCTVLGWSEAVLSIRVVKDACLEAGVLRFFQVAFVSIPPAFSIDSLIETTAEGRVAPGLFDADDVCFQIGESWGNTFFVVAKSCTYTIEPPPSG
jgi:hypothetical protein